MSARDLQTLALLLGLGLAGCGGGTTKDTTTDVTDVAGDDDDDDDDVRHSESDPYLNVEHAYFEGQFTYDSVNMALTELQIPGYGALPGTIDIQLGSAEWAAAGFDPNRTDLYCWMAFFLDDSAIPTWVSSNDTLWYGTEFTGGTGATNCNEPGYELDPNIWGADPLQELAAAGTWGLSVGDPTPSVVTFYEDNFPAEDWPNFFGGLMMNPLVQVDGPAGENGDMWSYAFVVDETTFEPYDDGSGYYTFVPAADANLGNNIATGWYQVNDIYIWTFSF